jgi:predicted nucleic acid-binding Zn ribbon protein
MEEKRDTLTPLKEILGRLFQDERLPFNMDDARIWGEWDRLVGATIAQHARPSLIRNRRLKVIVSDPIWLQELKFVEKDLVAQINRHLGRDAVERIEFRGAG